MTNEELITKIKAEIERLKVANPGEYNYQNAEGYVWALDDVLSFISTLESEKPIPNDLEEAAKKYAKAYTDNDNGNGGDDWEDDIKLTFIAGAKWQKEQMMKNALHGWLDEDNEPPYDLNVVCKEKIPFGEFKHGENIHIIIVKENEQC